MWIAGIDRETPIYRAARARLELLTARTLNAIDETDEAASAVEKAVRQWVEQLAEIRPMRKGT